MSDLIEEQLKIRKYLLGQLSEAECETVEKLFLTDPNFREETLIVEEDLLDEYLTKRMSVEDSAQFQSYYLATPQKREKLMVAIALDRYYTPQLQQSQNGQVSPPIPFVRRARFQRRAALAAAIALLAFASFGLWLWSKSQSGGLFAEYEAELRALNDQGNRSPADYTVSVPPNVTRQVPALDSTNVSPPATAKVVEILLILPDVNYSKYEAELWVEGDERRHTFADLFPSTTTRGKVLSIKLPSRLLGQRTYYVEVNGIEPEGKRENVGDYTFRSSAPSR
jgi:hypothetical protein